MTRRSTELKRFSHCVGQNWYHVILIPRARFPVFAQKHQRELAEKAIDLVCLEHNVQLFTKKIMPDHVHLFVVCTPGISIRKMVQLLKGGSSYLIRKNHLPLRKYPSLWSKGFMYRSVGSVSAETVKHYIEKSNNLDNKKQKKLSF